jgi:hypothetical protein
MIYTRAAKALEDSGWHAHKPGGFGWVIVVDCIKSELRIYHSGPLAGLTMGDWLERYRVALETHDVQSMISKDNCVRVLAQNLEGCV